MGAFRGDREEAIGYLLSDLKIVAEKIKSDDSYLEIIVLMFCLCLIDI